MSLQCQSTPGSYICSLACSLARLCTQGNSGWMSKTLVAAGSGSGALQHLPVLSSLPGQGTEGGVLQRWGARACRPVLFCSVSLKCSYDRKSPIIAGCRCLALRENPPAGV